MVIEVDVPYAQEIDSSPINFSAFFTCGTSPQGSVRKTWVKQSPPG